MQKQVIKLGGAYSNGEFGNRWVVRQVIAVMPVNAENDCERVTFKILVGLGRRSTSSCSMAEFVKWARYEVVRNENSWERIQVD